MTRWHHTKDIEENADASKLPLVARGVYKSLIKYLNRVQRRWNHVEAKLNILELEPESNQIIIDGLSFPADTELLDELHSIGERFIRFTFSDGVLNTIEMKFGRGEPLGSFEYGIGLLD